MGLYVLEKKITVTDTWTGELRVSWQVGEVTAGPLLQPGGSPAHRLLQAQMLGTSLPLSPVSVSLVPAEE